MYFTWPDGHHIKNSQEVSQMTNASDVIAELNRSRDDDLDRELEIQRLVLCYQFASPADKRVVWAALNKYAPCADCLQARGAF